MDKLMRKLTGLLGLCLIGVFLLSCCGKQTALNGGASGSGEAQGNGGESADALVLVNCWQPISDAYAVTLMEIGNGQAVDRLCYGPLMEMLSACQEAGLQPLVCSGYRDVEEQTRLYQNKVQRLMDSGLSRRDAESAAGREVAYPGTSEHHTGLAVDIVDVNYQMLDNAQENTAVQQWLMAHSWEYGFVLRYPTDKTDVTGIIYEPWHYRYVGKEAARVMYDQGLCLEEYLEQ